MISPLQTLTLREIRLPLRQPFTTSHGVVSERRLLLVEVRDADNRSVWSECVAMADPGYFPDTVDTSWLAIREWIAPRVLGRTFAEPSDAHRAITAGVRGHQMARAAVESAVWALTATCRDISLSELLGGCRNYVATGVALGIQPSLDMLVERAQRAVAEGYSRIKLKIAPEADIEPLQALREAVGPKIGLTADANSAYTLDDADHLRRLDSFELSMIEQPLGWDDLSDHAKLRRLIATPICLDESITGLARAKDMIGLAGGDVINLKPGRVGGLTEAKAVHDLCLRHQVPLWCGGMLESGIGRAYNVALASLPGFDRPGDLSPSARYWEQDIVTPEWAMNPQGEVKVPTNLPGIGVEVDIDRIDNLTVRREKIQPASATKGPR